MLAPASFNRGGDRALHRAVGGQRRAGRGTLDRLGGGAPPEAVNGTTGTATAIAAGRAHTCALQTETHAVICWGEDTFDQSTPPAAVDGVTGTATAIATGRSHTLAVLVPEPAGSWLGAVACTALLAIAWRRNPAHGEQR